ncbi:unnamed protein product [Calypogeia fissa]
MSFTMAELRHELHALGYGALPDDFIVSSLSQMQLDVPPQSRNNVENVGDRDGSISSRGVPVAGNSSRQVHGRPVPGDREFAKSRKSAVRKGGMGCVCFTPDFATELDEMRKMLKAMQGTKEVLFDSRSGLPTRRTIRKRMGLADEHETYVGNLLDQWRTVGRSIRSKRKEYLAADVGAVVKNGEDNGSAPGSENGTGHEQTQQEAVLDRAIQPQAEPSSSRLEGADDGCNPQAEGATLAERNEGIVENGLNEGDMNGVNSENGGLVGVSGIETGPVFKRQESSSAISPGVSYQQGGMLYPENFTIDTYKQSDLIESEDNLLQSHQDAEDNPVSPSARSSSAQLSKDQMLDRLSSMSKDQFLAVFQQSLDDLYPKDVIDQETFANVNQKISDTINHTHVSVRHHIAQQPVESENPLDLGVPVLVRTPDRRGAAVAALGGRHQSPLNDRSNMRIAEDQMVKKTELHATKALQRSSSVMLKRSRSSRVVSRRNEIVEEANDKHLLDSTAEGGSQQADSHLLAENKAITPPPTARKLKSERVFGHSKSLALSRKRNEIVEVSNDTHLSGNVDSHLLVENAATPPSSARKLKSERAVNRLAKSAEKSSSSPRLFRHSRTISALDGSDLDIPSLGLSPIKVRDQPASTLTNPSTREKSCVVNGLSEHRLGTHCSACHPPNGAVRKSSENNSQSATTGSNSPFGKNLNESPVSETEASPQQKRKEKETGVALGSGGSLSLKQRPASKKISTPVFEPKNNDLSSSSNSKVALLKTRRLGSSMDFASDSSRLTERRVPSLRSSTESSRSSGAQRAPSASSQASKGNSVSPYTKSSFSSRSATPNATPKDPLSSPFGKTPSFTSYGSRSSATTKDTLTPGGPRRGGKVDRVARFAEMQNLWKNDKFLKTSSKRKPQSFHRIFARLHLSHERCTAAYRERVIEDMRPTSNEPPPFVVPTALFNNSEGVCTF